MSMFSYEYAGDSQLRPDPFQPRLQTLSTFENTPATIWLAGKRRLQSHWSVQVPLRELPDSLYGYEMLWSQPLEHQNLSRAMLYALRWGISQCRNSRGQSIDQSPVMTGFLHPVSWQVVIHSPRFYADQPHPLSTHVQMLLTYWDQLKPWPKPLLHLQPDTDSQASIIHSIYTPSQMRTSIRPSLVENDLARYQCISIPSPLPPRWS